jgi:hypothetical protein
MAAAGKVPLTASGALRFTSQAKAKANGDGLAVEVRNELGNPVSLDRFEKPGADPL